MSIEDISQAQFLFHLMAMMKNKRVIIPTKREGWHKLFYELKQKEREGRPSFLDKLWFDWDGPYPTSPWLSEALDRCAITHYVVSPELREIAFSEDNMNVYLEKQQCFSPRLREYLDYASEEAKKFLQAG